MDAFKAKCDEAFGRLIKRKPYERCEIMMMIQWNGMKDKQKQLLESILFVDHTSLESWKEYVDLVTTLNPDRKSGLQNLISRAIDMIDEVRNRDDPKYLALHLSLVQVMSNKEEAKRHLDKIFRRSIGTQCPLLAKAWDDLSVEPAAAEVAAPTGGRLTAKLQSRGLFGRCLRIGDAPAESDDTSKSTFTAPATAIAAPAEEAPRRESLSKRRSSTESTTQHTSQHTSATTASDDSTEKVDVDLLLASARGHNTRATRSASIHTPAIAAPAPVPVASASSTSGRSTRKRVSFGGTPADLPTPDIASTSASSVSAAVAVSVAAAPSTAAASSTILSQPRIIVQGQEYLPLSLLGKGGSSAVQRVLSCRDGGIYAMKKISIPDGDDADTVMDSYLNEIELLQRLRGSSPYIIDLVASEVCRESRTILMLLEAGDVDLAKLLQQRLKATPSINNNSNNNSVANYLDPLFARMIWREMLLAVQHIHTHRIIHGDLKPANFVFVKGHLKLIDFGIAKHMSNDTTNIYRDSQIGTINYMAPEAIAPESVVALPPQHETENEDDFNHNHNNDDEHDNKKNSKGKNGKKKQKTHQVTMKLGRASDIWSLGCILYQMLYTRPPFAALTTIQKLSAIPNAKYAISYPAHPDVHAVESVQRCLQRDPRQRSDIPQLLNMSYLQVVSSSTVSSNSMKATPPSSNPSTLDADMLQKVLHVLQERALTSFQQSAAASQRIQMWFSGLDQSDLLQAVLQQGKDNDNGEEEEEEDDESDVSSNASTQRMDVDVEHIMSSSKASSSASVAAPPAPAVVIAEDEESDCDSQQSTVHMPVAPPSSTSSATIVSAPSAVAVAVQKQPIVVASDDKENSHVNLPSSSASISGKKRGLSVQQPALAQTAQTLGGKPQSHANALQEALSKRRRVLSETPSDTNTQSTQNQGRNTQSQSRSSAQLPQQQRQSTAAPAKKTLPGSLQAQIVAQAQNLRDAGSAAAREVSARWQRPQSAADDESNLKAFFARKMGDMRKFMDFDEENATATESLDLSGWIA